MKCHLQHDTLESVELGLHEIVSCRNTVNLGLRENCSPCILTLKIHLLLVFVLYLALASMTAIH